MATSKAIKQKIARDIQAAIRKELSGGRYVQDGRGTGGMELIDVECHDTDWLNMQIRVKTHSNGTHYFNVKVSGE